MLFLRRNSFLLEKIKFFIKTFSFVNLLKKLKIKGFFIKKKTQEIFIETSLQNVEKQRKKTGERHSFIG